MTGGTLKNGLIKLLADNRKVEGKRFEVFSQGETDTIYIYDQIVSSDAEAAWFGGVSAQTLAPILRESKAAKIDLRINSIGGDVFAASAIVAAMADSKAEIYAYIDGLCASAATVVASAAKTVSMAETASYMIHRAWTMAVGNASDFLDLAATLEKVDGQIAAIYSKRTKMEVDALLALMDAETWYSADEAKAAGFVDEVSAVIKSAGVEWNLSAYKNAPAVQARIESVKTPEAAPIEKDTASLAAFQQRLRVQQLLDKQLKG